MKALLSFIVTSLVDRADAVQVTETDQDDTLVLELQVAKEDLGKVIGKQGRTVRAIRTLVTATASRTNRKVKLEIKE